MSAVAPLGLASFCPPAPPPGPLPSSELDMSPTTSSAVSDKPPRKRKRYTRTTTGCRACRVQRVKCPEGPVLPYGPNDVLDPANFNAVSHPPPGSTFPLPPGIAAGPSIVQPPPPSTNLAGPQPPSAFGGRKVACLRCWETDRPCYYPVPGQKQRGKDKEDLWERAADVEYWAGAGVAGREAAYASAGTGAAPLIQTQQAAQGSLVPPPLPLPAAPTLQPQPVWSKPTDPAWVAPQWEASNDMKGVEWGKQAVKIEHIEHRHPHQLPPAPQHAAPPLHLSMPPPPPHLRQPQLQPLAQPQPQAPGMDWASFLGTTAAAVAGAVVPPMPSHEMAMGGMSSIGRENMGRMGFPGASVVPISSEGDEADTDASANTNGWVVTAPATTRPAFNDYVGPGVELNPAMLTSLFNATGPAGVLGGMTLAGLSATTEDRAIVSYFEREGCNEIVSTTAPKHNWIFTQLFPRLLSTLNTGSHIRAKDDVNASVREYLHMCLLYIAYVHRGNVEPDATKTWHWRSEAARHRQKANYAILRAKVRFPEDQWKTEEYLMGFFVRAMGDMLDSGNLQMDASTAFELSTATTSSFYPSLRDMIALYSTIQFTCSPLDAGAGATTTSPSITPTQTPRPSSPSNASCSNASSSPLSFMNSPISTTSVSTSSTVRSISRPAPLFSVPSEGPDWVEKFVGFSRRVIRLLGHVNGLVMQRAALIRRGEERGRKGAQVREEAESLLHRLGEAWDWDEKCREVGKSDRIQRGNEVMRSALKVMLLTEVLNVDLRDGRVAGATGRVLELVADSEPVAMGGFQWALTILAIYNLDKAERHGVAHMIRVALSMSFGQNYRGSEEILTLCWEVLDRNGSYENGIAPWREAMSALGRNLFV